MSSTAYAFTVHLEGLNFASARERVFEALKSEGFGVLTEIDVQETLKKKLDVDFRRYLILGACNPPLAHEALSRDLSVGLFLPCNLVLYENDEGQVIVQVGKPSAMLSVVGQPGFDELARKVDAKIERVVAALS